MSVDFHDRYGGDWVLVLDLPEAAHWRWMRVSDGHVLEVTPAGVDFHDTLIGTDDPAGWLTEHLGAPPMDFGDLAAERHRRQLRQQFIWGWQAQARATHGAYGMESWSYPDAAAHRFQSVPT